jgi:hypothetical protein
MQEVDITEAILAILQEKYTNLLVRLILHQLRILMMELLTLSMLP